MEKIKKLGEAIKHSKKNTPKGVFLAASVIAILNGCGGGGGNEINKEDYNGSNINETIIYEENTTKENIDEILSLVTEEDIKKYLEKINEYRKETQDCGEMGIFEATAPLTWNNQLGNSALEHSKDMAKSNTFSHNGSGTQNDITAMELNLGRGSYFYERITNNGYKYSIVEENIAAGQLDYIEAIDDLMNSPHHCANIMNPDIKEFGMAYYEDNSSDYQIYWTQNFGTKR